MTIDGHRASRLLHRPLRETGNASLLQQLIVKILELVNFSVILFYHCSIMELAGATFQLYSLNFHPWVHAANGQRPSAKDQRTKDKDQGITRVLALFVVHLLVNFLIKMKYHEKYLEEAGIEPLTSDLLFW